MTYLIRGVSTLGASLLKFFVLSAPTHCVVPMRLKREVVGTRAEMPDIVYDSCVRLSR